MISMEQSRLFPFKTESSSSSRLERISTVAFQIISPKSLPTCPSSSVSDVMWMWTDIVQRLGSVSVATSMPCYKR